MTGHGLFLALLLILVTSSRNELGEILTQRDLITL